MTTSSSNMHVSDGIPTAAFAAASSSGAENDSDNKSSGEIPQLPAADPNANIPSLKFGETLRFDELGPIIINTDGTTRRIDNWSELTEKEKEVTWRRISKRNEQRRKMLLEQQQLQQGNRDVEAGGEL